VARRLVRTAAAVVSVTPYWAQQDASFFGREAACITNGFDPEEMPTRVHRADRAVVTIAYVGQLVPEQSLEPFIEAMRRLSATDNSSYRAIRFVYAGKHPERITDLCRTAGLADVVTVSGQLERRDALQLMVDADLLLVAGISPAIRNPWLVKGLYPGKVFEYLGAGRPILCVPEDGGALKELLEHTRSGVSLTTPEAICEYLADCVRQKSSGLEIAHRPDPAAVSKYTRRNQTEILAALLDRTVTRVRTGLAL
jgi:glycosyltransferase involved in cell wall biosynthesis